MSGPSEEREKDRLAALERRISEAKSRGVSQVSHVKKDYSQAQLAWRMVVELVSGLLIGFGIGYGLDVFLGTLPVFMVLFIGLGFAAGVRVMLRSVREIETEVRGIYDESRDIMKENSRDRS